MIYFVESARGDAIYVGFAGDGNEQKRIRAHESAERKLIAVMHGGEDIESRLHRSFTDRGLSAPGVRNKSTYVGAEIESYVTWLVLRGYACTSLSDLEHWPTLPWETIDPIRSGDVGIDPNGQLGLPIKSVPIPVRERVALASEQAAHLSLSDEWYTPAAIIEAARAVLGAIDLDVASSPAANRTVKAAAYYSRVVNGLDLSHPWRGRVWMNPPYGDNSAPFAARLVSEVSAANVSASVALFNANAMSSQWFETVFDSCAAIGISRGRINFGAGVVGQKSSSPSHGSVLVYWGANVDRFMAEFHSHAHCLRK